jgi:hypothetical protein
MAALLKALLQFLLPYLLDIGARLLAIQVGLKQAATETQPYAIQNDAEYAKNALIDGYSGNFAIRESIAELRDYITTQDSGLLAAIGGIPSPPTPPSVPDIVDGVWRQVDPFSRSGIALYGEEQHDAAEWAELMKAGGSAPAKMSPFFDISYPPPIPD